MKRMFAKTKVKTSKLSRTAEKSSKTKAKAKTKAVIAKAKTKVKAKVKKVKAMAPMNKSQMIAHYMETLDWDRKDVTSFLAAQEELLIKRLDKTGIFVMPGLFKITAIKKAPQKMPAIKKGTMVKGFGGTEVKSPGRAAFTKPASVRFRLRGMKKLKTSILG